MDVDPDTSSMAPVILTALERERSLAPALEGAGYAVIHVYTAAMALEWARDVQPDAIIVQERLPDMPGVGVCQLLSGDPRIGRQVPIVLLSAGRPTEKDHIAALRAGAWDCLRQRGDPEELLLKLHNYLQAKRTVDFALAEGLLDPATGLHSRGGLARRARELGALMARERKALACVVFSLDVNPDEPSAEHFIAKAARVLKSTERISDVIGALGPTEFAVVAPGTDHAGAVKLAQRIAEAIGHGEMTGTGAPHAPVSKLRVGYDAVANLRYSPIDPLELLAHATAALRTGKPEPGFPWVRRFDGQSGDNGSGPRISGPERRISV
jgi:diguanylate cyclase (GGDEF)-like protein